MESISLTDTIFSSYDSIKKNTIPEIERVSIILTEKEVEDLVKLNDRLIRTIHTQRELIFSIMKENDYLYNMSLFEFIKRKIKGYLLWLTI
jgi:hypothetical protein